ncbi:MAG: 30S ribosomal protein S27ae [Methanomicrobiales archaeon]|jgi:small subunit ribosomal protein S27Ae|nr:30S ribosomal protein S27ae [Methanomicrobiales archaeon]
MAVKRCEYYSMEGNIAVPKLKTCPRCGRGVFMGEHEDRFSCGKCGYTEFKQ